MTDTCKTAQARVSAVTRRPASVQFRLASLVLACVLPVWIVAGGLLYYAYHSSRAWTEQRMLETARTLTMVVDRELASIEASLNALASSPLLDSSDLSAFYRQAQVVLSAYPGANILLADASGQELVNTFRPFGMPLPKHGVPNAVREVFASGKPVVSNAFAGAITRRLMISVHVPVFRKGQIVYDLGMNVAADRFSSVLLQQHLPPEWLGVIVDSNQVIVGRNRLAAQFVGQQMSDHLRLQVRDIAEGIAAGVNLEGTPQFNGFSRSAMSSWSVVIGVPKAVIMADIWRWLWWTLAVAALLSLTGLLLALHMTRRIAGPIQDLVTPALALGRGEPIAVEYSDLKEANEVGASLVKASQIIHQRVEERAFAEAARHETEELKQLNAELKRNATEARARATELAAIMDAVPAVTFIAHDPECQQMTCNRAGYDLLRLPPGANVSTSLREGERLSAYRLMKDGKELSPDELPTKTAAASGHAVRDYEYTVAFPDGTSRDIFGNAVPLFDDAGKVRGAVGAFVDVTTQKQAQTQLQSTAERLQAILATAQIGLNISDRHGRVVDTNPAYCRIVAYSREELIGRNFTDYTHPDDIEKNLELRRGLDSGLNQGYELEKRYIRKDGKVIWVRTRTSALGSELRVAAIEDITARKHAEEEREKLQAQLSQAQKMESIGRLAGGVAHDFNNLLMVIQSYAEILRDGLSANDRLQKNVQQIVKAADRAATLTRQMLAFSRKQVLSPVVLDLNAVIHEAAKMLDRLIGEDIELQVSSAESLWATKADPDQLVQVLMNLCVNARDAMPEGGRLTIETANVTVAAGANGSGPPVPPGDYVKLAVMDTGAGMSREIQEKIFEPFFTTKETGKGTGLGLAMVYGIVNQSGGYIWVDSEPGKGACFTVYLPRAAGAIAPEAPTMISGPLLGTETLLVAEDEEFVREAVGDYLRSLGYTVLVANSGQQALSVAAQHEGHIDLLITDVVMPEINGRELSETLGSLRPDLKTIYMSGYTDDAMLRHGVQEPGVSFLQKPFSLSTLARKVRESVGPTETVQ